MEELYNSLIGSKNGEDSLQFCQYAYGNYSGIYKYPELSHEVEEFPEEADEETFKANMENCYQKNESLKEYCDDAYHLEFFGSKTEKDQLECYN